MKILEYREHRQWGNSGFPAEIHLVDEKHPRYRMPLHWHEENEIIFIKKGRFDYEIGQAHGSVYAGDILFVNSGEFHAGTPVGCEYYCIIFSPSLLSREGYTTGEQALAPFLNGDISVSLCLTNEKAKRLISKVRKIVSFMEKRPLGYELQVQGLFYQFYGNIVENKYYAPSAIPANKRRLTQLKDVLALIETEYSSPLTLEQLAHSAGMSPKYFCQYFKQMTRYSPIEYLNIRRVEMACYHIISGWQNMTELAYECGFNDLSYFIRMFKRIVGVTPKQYALAHQREG